jgi:hypothetical protein
MRDKDDVTTRGGPMARGADLASVAEALLERTATMRWRGRRDGDPY